MSGCPLPAARRLSEPVPPRAGEQAQGDSHQRKVHRTKAVRAEDIAQLARKRRKRVQDKVTEALF